MAGQTRWLSQVRVAAHGRVQGSGLSLKHSPAVAGSIIGLSLAEVEYKMTLSRTSPVERSSSAAVRSAPLAAPWPPRCRVWHISGVPRCRLRMEQAGVEMEPCCLRTPFGMLSSHGVAQQRRSSCRARAALPRGT